MTPATVPNSNSIQLATYNAAADLLERNLAGGRAGKVAVMDDSGSCSYSTLAERAGLSVRGLSDIERGVHQAPADPPPLKLPLNVEGI